MTRKCQVGAPAEEDIQSWAQHSCLETVPDDVMRYIGRALPSAVSFVFSCQARLHTSSRRGPSMPLEDPYECMSRLLAQRREPCQGIATACSTQLGEWLGVQ